MTVQNEPQGTIPETPATTRHENLIQELRDMDKPATLEDVKRAFKKRLYLEDDDEILDIVLACACDRKLPGDPVWLFLISASGGTKTELVRNLSGDDIYTLDSLTPHSLISGKIERTPEGSYEPVKGILTSIRNRVLVIKDFTVILNKRREDRDDIFGQLRSLYDGYLEYAYGTSAQPVRINATIGLIAACVPAIQMYQRLYTILGERFLTVRHRPNRREASTRALANLGEEAEMREELSSITERFLRFIEPKQIEEDPGCRTTILDIADATAKLRTPVPIQVWHFEVQDASMPTIEYPTRLSKQLLKLAKLLALVRGKTKVTNAEINTVKRVARDSCVTNRIKILQKTEVDKAYTTKEISEGAKIPLTTCWREMKELEYLGLCTYERTEEAKGSFGSMRHAPEKDGWKIIDPLLYDILESPTLPYIVSGLSPSREQEKSKEGVVCAAGGDTREMIENERNPRDLQAPSPLEVQVPTPPGAEVGNESSHGTEANVGKETNLSSGDQHIEKIFLCPECKARGRVMQFSFERDLAAHMGAIHEAAFRFG